MSLATAAAVSHSDFIGVHHSELTDHGQCCQLAKAWLFSMHRSQSFSRSEGQNFHAPTWLRRMYQWGPVQWPLSWCEAVQKKQIDCGVFAAFSRAIMQQCYGQDAYVSERLEKQHLGTFEIFPAQIILAQPATYTEQWNRRWAHIFQNYMWIGGENVYHEVIAVARKDGSDVRIYDPTEGVWLDPILQEGINGVIGVSVRSPKMYNWGLYRVGQSQWITL